MKLRDKTLLIIGATFITLTLVLNLLSRTILLDNFDQLQAEAVQQNLRHARKLIQNQIEQIDISLSDWAPWDDSYQFVQDGNQEYIESNLVQDTFTNLKLNLIVYVDKSGKVIYGRAFDLVKKSEIPLPQDLLFYLTPGSLLLHHTRIDSEVTGILLLSEASLLVASKPILQTNHEGTIQGTLIFGRYLDEAAVDFLSNELELSLNIESFRNPSHPDFDLAAQSLTLSSPSIVYPLDRETVAGYALLPDVFGQPGLILQVQTPNKIVQQGQTSFTTFILTLLLSGLAVGLTIMWLLEKHVLSRLTDLNQRLNDIRTSHSFNQRVSEQGTDELAGLGHSVNMLLASIEESQLKLHNLNTELELSLSELRQVQEQKDRFFTHAGHEFRTPLANLRTRLYLARKKPDNINDHLTVLERVADQMTALVEDVFDIAHYSKHGPKLDERDIRLQEITQMIFYEQTAKAQAKKVSFSYTMPEKAIWIYADAGRLKQALSNVFNYIINFTPAGASIATHIDTFADETIIHIESDNIDIKAESESQIFQPFFRASEGGADSTGLSLTLAKEIIERHFGRITYESNGQTGGIFTIKLLLMSESTRKTASEPGFLGVIPD